MIQTILVPLDGSTRAEQILLHATNLAKKFEASLTLLQIITPVYPMGSIESPGYAQVMLDEMKVLKESANTYLKELKAKLKEEGLEANVRVEQGQPVERILAIADEIDADLIAMNSHGRTGLPRVIFGSVAAGVLHGTNRPLYLIRSDESES